MLRYFGKTAGINIALLYLWFSRFRAYAIGAHGSPGYCGRVTTVILIGLPV